MSAPPKINVESIRTTHPSAWPQYPYNDKPRTPEGSEVRYAVFPEYAKRIRMRDGVELVYDLFRPFAPGEKFPALLAFSPYSRQLQSTAVPVAPNEAGITPFWVPRGYAHLIIDVRGSNDSEGSWDHFGPEEQADLKEVIEFVAGQPWCNGKVGMVGCSYFAMSQLLAAEQRPEGLAAVFPLDALTDLYRDMYFHGGIPSSFPVGWFPRLLFLNVWSGRLKDPSGIFQHFDKILGGAYQFDEPYWHERSSWPNLHKVEVPCYFGCDWTFTAIHLRGAFDGWAGIPASTPKRMFIGPAPQPRRPFATYHFEALRWYDHHLKGMDTGVWEGAPINLYVQGEESWRGENEWPLARTDWKELFLSGETLSESAGPSGERTYTCDPESSEFLNGLPNLVWRTEPMSQPTEITGPMVLHLVATSNTTDTDWIAVVKDEAPDGSARELTRGWLRASHRALDPERSTRWKPWHPHTGSDPVTPGEPIEYVIEIVPTSNFFREGHRLRLEISSCDSFTTNTFWYHRALSRKATNTIHTGRGGSWLLTPFVPR